MACFQNRKDDPRDQEKQITYYREISIPPKKPKRDRKIVAMAEIGYKTVYDAVMKTWMIERLEIYKISNKIINLIPETMKNMKVDLNARSQILAE